MSWLIARLRPRGRTGRLSLSTRLAALSTVAAGISLFIAGVAAYLVISSVLHDQIDDSLRGAPSDIGRGPADELDLDGFCDVVSSAPPPGGSPGEFNLQLVLPDGTVCADDSTPQARLMDSDLAAAGDSYLRDGTYDNGNPARVHVVPLEGGGVLLISRDTSSVVKVLQSLLIAMVAVLLLGLTVALLLSRTAARAGLRPVTQFALVAEDIALTGDVETHAARWPQHSVEGANAQREDELDRLSRAFASMTAALAASRERQRRLIADAGHELRTPLTSLRANIDLLRRSRDQQRSLLPDEESQLLADLSGQATELSALVDQVDQLAATESVDDPDESVRLDQVVEAALARIAWRSTGHEFDVTLQPWVVEGQERSIERAVVNLLDNAVKFSPPGGRITVRLAHGVLRVADRGRGIAPGDEHHAFERFWRSPSARALPGSGLGLSIVRDVAERHGGDVRLRSRANGGTEAILSLPGARPL